MRIEARRSGGARRWRESGFVRAEARGSGRSGRYVIVGSEGSAAPVAQRRGEGRTGHGLGVADGGRVGQGGGGCALRGSFCPDHPPRRHPGLGPGSTGPRGGGKRLRPPPSPQSGPRNESGVTGLFGLGSGRHSASLRSRLGLVARWCRPCTGLLQTSATRIAVAAPTPSPRTWSGVHRAAGERQEAPAIPLAAEWTPERVRGDGAFLGSVPAATLRRFGAGWGLWRAGASTRRSCLRRLVHALQSPHPRRHPGLGPGSTGPRGGGKRLRPSPSPRSGPRNESGVTGCLGYALARYRSVRERLWLWAGTVCGRSWPSPDDD